MEVCRSCYDQVMREPDSTASEQSNDETSSFQEEINRSREMERLDESLQLTGISPLKTHGLPISSKVKAARVKLERSFQAHAEITSRAYKIDRDALCRDTRKSK